MCSTLANFQTNRHRAAQPSTSARSTFAHLLPFPSCPPAHGATLPTQALCSCRKERKHLEPFPYSAKPAAGLRLFPANWQSSSACAWAGGGQEVTAASHTTACNEVKAAPAEEVGQSQSPKASLNTDVKDLVLLRCLLVQRK